MRQQGTVLVNKPIFDLLGRLSDKVDHRVDRVFDDLSDDFARMSETLTCSVDVLIGRSRDRWTVRCQDR